jgi:hypothetical protein
MKIMQEQPHYNITPEQGWSKMRPALDNAMPADRPSRRFGFLWWSTSAVLMSGVVGLFIFKGTSFFTQYPSSVSPVIESIQQNSTGTIHLSNEVKTIESKVNANTAVPSALTPEQKINATKKEATKNSTPSIRALSPAKKNTKPYQTEPIAATIKNNEPVSISQIQESTSYTSAVEPNEIGEKSDIQEVVANTSLRNVSIIESLPGLNASSVLSNESVNDVVYAGSGHRSRTSTPFIEPSIAVSGLVGMNGGIGGIASAGVDLNVSRRLSVTTGIGYLAYTPQASLFSGSKDLAANSEFNAILNYDPTYEGINTYVDGTSVNAAAGYNVINPLVENLRQWQVSAGLKWKMSGRFYIDGGVTIGFGTTAYSEYPIVSGDPLSSSPYVKIGNSLNTYDVIRSTMTSVYAGIGYSATKHFDVFAQWTHGFDSYILSEPGIPSADLSGDARTDYIRGLNIGLRYTL